MAFVFQTFDKRGRAHPKWRFQYKDWTGKKRTATGRTSKRATEKLAERIQAEHDEIRQGFRPPPNGASKHAGRPFGEVKEEYLAWGASQGGRGGRPWGKGHARMRRSILDWWEEQLNLSVLADLDKILPDVETALRELQEAGRSGKTLSNYSEALAAFCRWCTNKSRQYLAEDPLDGITRFDTTPKTRRRAMTASEINKVLRAAPEHRCLLYEVAFCSGLRANELRSLSARHLDAERQGLHLEPDWTKDRRPGFQILPAELVTRLQTFLRERIGQQLYERFYSREDANLDGIPHEPLLYVPSHPARSLDIDLEAAGVPKTLPSGKVDFHAARTAYINLTFTAGADIREAQKLARHATPDMTINVYGRTEDERLLQVVENVGQQVLNHRQEPSTIQAQSEDAESLSGCNESGYQVEAAGIEPAFRTT